MTTILAIPDSHAHYQHNNDRATWLSKLILDIHPDIVLHGGDAADMPSLSSYDKGKRSFHGRSYKADIDSSLDFQERLWEPIKSRKKRMPRRVILHGNHELRIERALDLSPELVGTVGLKDLEYEYFYDEVVPYDGSTPGIWEFEDISFAHYFVAGVSGKAIGGDNQARLLMSKNNTSSVCFHSHTLDFSTKNTVSGKSLNCLVSGCYQDYDNDWAGNVTKLWKRGISVLRNVENGNFDWQWISLEAIKKEYG